MFLPGISLILRQERREEFCGVRTNYCTQLTRFSAETWTSLTISEPGVKLVVLIIGHSSGGGNLFLLLKGKVLKSLVEALIIGILFFRFFCLVIVALLTFIIFIIELPPEECENQLSYRCNRAHTGSYMTLMIKLQLGHVAISSQSLSCALEISKRSPQGHG